MDDSPNYIEKEKGTMNENEVVNEVVETMTKVDPETLAAANEQLLNKAIETTLANQPAPQPKPGLSTGAKVGLGVLGGTAIGIALDHWVFPKISTALENAKAKRAKKKAEKAAKKAAKAAVNVQETKPENQEAHATTEETAPDPRTYDTSIKD